MELALIVVKMLWFALTFVWGVYVGVVFHELGHSLAALLATRQKVELQVGTSEGRGFSLGRLAVRLGIQGFRYGFTRYERANESVGKQAFVALCGPLATLAWGGACVWGALASAEDMTSFAWILWAGFFIANFRIFMVVVWPFEYRPNGPEGEVWLSDSLDVWRMLKK
ncbi:MAG: M50 family metallopeptidase [Verrucomicrobiota bacterium]